MDQSDDSVMAELENLTGEFERVVDGRRAVLVGAAMGRVLGETIEDVEVLQAAINTLMANAVQSHQQIQLCDTNVTKH